MGGSRCWGCVGDLVLVDRVGDVMGFCTFPGCKREFAARGLCSGHYQQRQRGIELRPIWGDDPNWRFWQRVKKADGDACWEWDNVAGRRYGQFYLHGKQVQAHRASWELNVGEIPDGIKVLHRCDHTHCVRPDHLFLGTQADNVADMISKGRAVFPDWRDRLRTQ